MIKDSMEVNDSIRKISDVEILDSISHSPFQRARISVASNPNISKSIEERLLSDRKTAVRIALALNDSVSIETQLKLTKDSNRLVRRALLERNHVTDEVLSLLRRDKNFMVRRRCIDYMRSRSAILDSGTLA